MFQVPLKKGIKKTVEYFRNELQQNKNSMKHSFNPDDATKNYIEEDFSAIPRF